MRHVFFALVFTLCFAAGARAQQPAAAPAATEYPKEEFRGAWIASVINLDWPSSRGGSMVYHQATLLEMIRELKEAGMNAIMFQVRSECDALYDSPYEPWSYWLTGVQGQAPSPYFDPLEEAIEEAHRLGMELHAWFNPYRCERQIGNYPLDDTHAAVEHPEWTLTFGGDLRLLDPGLPEVRDYIATVVTDVVRRYDVDGVHFDDYFYPYPPDQITDEDDATFAVHGEGFSSRAAWRRDNINRFVAQVKDSIAAVKPGVKFGISPFGIWRNGVPSGITGLSAYDTIYADALAWLEADDVDYLVPQLYWAFGGGQDYGKLAPWWAEQSEEIHLYTGHGLYRSDPNTFWGTTFSADEIPRQVRFNRDHEGLQGSVFFRAKNITQYPSKGFVDSLRTDLFRYPALTPTMPWKDLTPPAPPEALAYAWTGEEEVTLSWRPPPQDAAGAAAARFAVYRTRSAAAPDFAAVMQDARNLVAVTGDTTVVDRPGLADDPYYYFVASVSDNSVESAPSSHVVVEGRAVAAEPVEPAVPFSLAQNFPNPFTGATEIGFTLERPAAVRLVVYDLLGRTVATLVDGHRGAGRQSVRWDAGALPSGTYFYALEAQGRRLSKMMVVMR